MTTIKAPIRDITQIREQYEVETGLAKKLLKAPKEERRSLYGQLYDELFRRVPHHPMLTNKVTSDQRREEIKEQMTHLNKLLSNDSIFLEVGPGDCSLSFEVAKQTKYVYGIDVSEVITKNTTVPHNFELILSDGSSIPVEPNSVDVAFSNQLMEHLHPDDALDQLINLFNAIKPHGVYYCITPNRLNGPHDISKRFDMEAKGFHLKEYTTAELAKLFKQVGFSKVSTIIGAKGIYLNVPVLPIAMLEKLLDLLPIKLTKMLARTRLMGAFLEVRIIGEK